MNVLGKIVKYTTYLFLAFILLYIDGIESEGGMSIGQLWKIPVIIYLLCKVVFNLKYKFVKYRFGYALIKIFTRDSILNTMGNASNVMRFMCLPLFIAYIDRFVKKKRAISLLLFIAHAIILSFVPFYLGIIEERQTYIGATMLGVQSLVGPFLNGHTSSVYLSTSVLVIMSYLRFEKMDRVYFIFNIILSLLGIYFLYLTYVRTGYLMFAVGAFIILMPKKGLLKQITFGIIVLSISYISFNLLIAQEEIFRQRIYEQNDENTTEEEEITGNGRLMFWRTSYNLWLDSPDAWNYLFGVGYSKLEHQQYIENDLSVGSHNGFLDALSQNGLIGLILLCLFYVYLIKYNYKYRKNKFFMLFISWLISNLSFQMVQGGVFIFYDLLSAFIIMMPKIDSEHVKNKKKEELRIDSSKFFV